MTQDAHRLLVVDDEADFAAFVREVAQDLGFVVEVAGDGRLMRRQYAAFKPTVIVLDMVLPDQDGIELVRWLGGQPNPPPVIAATGFNPEYVKWAQTVGQGNSVRVVATLHKPVKLADLRAALEAVKAL